MSTESSSGPHANRPWIAKYTATAIAFLTPVFYLNGWAFREGYLGFFHLEPSMFPTDVPETFTFAALAWMGGATNVLSGITAALRAHWVIATLLPACLLFVLAVAGHAVGGLANRRRVTKGSAFSRRRELHPAVRLAATWILKFFLGAYFLYTGLVVIGAILLLLVAPFGNVGARAAAVAAQKGFPDSPLVEIASPGQASTPYKIIECSAQFCALFSAGEVVTVPSSSIPWATSAKIHPSR